MVRPSDTGIALRVEGRVQGVGFRWWTRDLALELGVRGWVRNSPDGSVEVHAAGTARALEELERRLAVGPPAARVISVTATGPAEVPSGAGFEIRY